MRRSTLFLTLGLALGACRSATMPPIGFCTAPASVSVIATVTDSVTGAAVADSASGAIQDGTYRDSLRLVPSTAELVAGTQIGTFTITINRPRYQTWVRSGVRVSQRGPCGNVIPIRIDARLQPAP
jgi:hypothetical protein